MNRHDSPRQGDPSGHLLCAGVTQRYPEFLNNLQGQAIYDPILQNMVTRLSLDINASRKSRTLWLQHRSGTVRRSTKICFGEYPTLPSRDKIFSSKGITCDNSPPPSEGRGRHTTPVVFADSRCRENAPIIRASLQAQATYVVRCS